MAAQGIDTDHSGNLRRPIEDLTAGDRPRFDDILIQVPADWDGGGLLG